MKPAPSRNWRRCSAATPVATWRAYLTFHYLNNQADIMPAAFDEASFGFNGKVLGGSTEPRARWKRAVNEINGPYGVGPIGDAVGRLYVQAHFPPEAKAAIKAVVDNLLAAYQQRIQSLEWMSPETRKVAIRKAQTVRVKIGYPDRWKDYTALTIEPGDAYGNRKRMSLFESNRVLARLNGPTDKDEWSQGPQIVNAYYTAEFNEIGFPAAILQAPLFDPAADPAVNYGGIGGVIGHEMGHGYDDQGAKSDENGVLRTWWQPEDEVRFAALTKKLAAQYSSYSPLPGLNLNGNATSGENIGDLGGLSVALAAYQTSLGGKPAPVIDGLTGTQRFFLSWAQVWRGKYREPYSAPGRHERRAFAGHVPGQRRGPQHGRLVRGLQRDARSRAVRRARGSRADLVALPAGTAARAPARAHRPGTEEPWPPRCSSSAPR